MIRCHRSLPPLGIFPVFEAAARLGSFTRAAAEFGVTQAAVSKRIRELEDHLGSPLFRRAGRTVALTASGQALYHKTAAALDYLDDACRAARGDRQQAMVTIAANSAVAHFWLGPKLHSFGLSATAAPLSLVASDRTPDQVAERNDLAILYGNGNSPGWTLELLFEEVLMPVASADYLAQIGMDLPAAAKAADDLLSRLALLDHERIEPDWINWGVWLRAVGWSHGTPAIARRFNSYTLAVAAALDGKGAALGSLPLLRDLIDAGRLGPVTGLRLATGRGYYLGHRDDKALSTAAQDLRQWLIAQAQAA